MAIPFTPVAATALRYGAVALAGYTAARWIPAGRLPEKVEETMDKAPLGLRLMRAPGQVAGSLRARRAGRLGGRFGPRFTVDGAVLARVRVRIGWAQR